MLSRSLAWRFLSVLLLFSMVLPVSAVDPGGRNVTSDQLQAVFPEDILVMPTRSRSDLVEGQIKGEAEPAIYIVQLSDPPLASYTGGVAGLPATSPRVTGDDSLDVTSQPSQDYREHLAARQNTILDRIAQQTGRAIDPVHTYDVAYNGMALMLTPDEAGQVAAMPGVVRVVRSFMRYIQTDTTPEFLNAVGIWDGTHTGALDGTRGEGIVIGILDTGINMGHPSFASVDGDAYAHTNPLGSGVYTGWCNPAHPSYDSNLVCNDKLIGVYSYPAAGNNPIDDNSHGSHTASTAAGNVLYNVQYGGYTFAQIVGMAPRANIIAYDVCSGSGCPLESILAGINDAAADGVDVINYSIGGGPQNPWDDPDSEAFRNARAAGIFVATSAGNDGPGPGTVGSPGNAPWLTTVANTTISRVLANTLDVTGPGTVPVELEGLAAVHGSEGPAIAGDIEASIAFADAVSPGNIEGCNPFPANAFSGMIALIQRGGCTFADKVSHASAAGAVAVVVYNNAGGPPMVMGGLTGTAIPAVFLTKDDGEAVRDWILAATNPTARINAGASRIVNGDWSDIMSSTSSRGPNVNADYLKPDIAAPGTNIFAAYAGGSTAFGMMSGTSMASPHVAGAAALLRALQSGWTPAEIQSALMMTSYNQGLLKEDAATPADPFDIGAGRLDLTGAALAGLLLDETTANYSAADPALDGDPRGLNIPSLADAACLQECSWERTFTNPTDQTVNWTISFDGDVPLAATPSLFQIGPGASQQVVFTATVTSLPADQWLFGNVILTPDSGPSPALHMPVSVLPTSGVLPSLVEVNTRRNAGSQWIRGLESIEITDMAIQVSGLVQATLIHESLIEDPTPSDSFDGTGGTFHQLLDVPDGAKRLVAEIIASESPDLDLHVGMGDAPSSASLVCSSAAPSWDEKCDIADPAAGTWWVLVQNWQGSSSQPDALTLAVAVVPDVDATNMIVSGPTSVPALTPFDLLLSWNTPEMAAGDRWYGAILLGSNAASPGDIGTLPVNVVRHEDAVVKTVHTPIARVGDILTYTLTVLPNVTPGDLTYTITDTIPAGLAYVPGSATATDGSVAVEGDTLTWTGVMDVAQSTYEMTTSLVDPACAVPLANDGAFLDLSVFGVMPNSAISGDSVWYTAFSTGDPFQYWGSDYTGISFADDGIAFFDSTPGDTPWANQDLPHPDDPNNLLAMIWKDWEIVYDEAANRGVSLATLGGDGAIVSFTGIQAWGNPSQTLDFQVFMWRTPDDAPGRYEIIFAYNNIEATLNTGTIGIEDAAGANAVKYAYNDAALDTLTDGMAICFDWVQGGEPVEITYQVQVEAEVGALRNVAVHETDNPGSQPAETFADVLIVKLYWMPIAQRH